MDGFTWEMAGAGAGWVVVGVMVLLLFRGVVIPGKTHDEIVRDLKERSLKQESLIANLTEQNKVLLDSAIPTVNSVLTALRQAAGEQSS